MQESARDPEMFAKLDDLVETITATSRSQHDQLCVFRQALADHLVIDDWATPIVARGPRPEFEMEQVLPGADPDDPDSDPITDSNDLKDAGDARAASRIRDLTAVHPPELLLPGRKSMVPYSIQWPMRLKPARSRHDLLTLFDLLQHKKIKQLSHNGCLSAKRGTHTNYWEVEA